MSAHIFDGNVVARVRHGRPWVLMTVTDDAMPAATSNKAKEDVHGVMGCA